jgi:hypothetical protein
MQLSYRVLQNRNFFPTGLIVLKENQYIRMRLYPKELWKVLSSVHGLSVETQKVAELVRMLQGAIVY